MPYTETRVLVTLVLEPLGHEGYEDPSFTGSKVAPLMSPPLEVYPKPCISQRVR